MTSPHCLIRLTFTVLLLATAASFAAERPAHQMEMSRPARPWEFLPVVGTRAALFGNEAGQMEAWAYPLKIFRGLHLTFYVGGQALPAESLVRTTIVRPESSTLVYTGDNFSVRETFFVPVHEASAVLLLDVETAQALEIEARFTSDFQLEWPAALGGTFTTWDPIQHAFVFGEEKKRFAALFGSPSASDVQLAYQSNYSSSAENTMRLGPIPKGKHRKVLFLAASTDGLASAQTEYRRLSVSYEQLLEQSDQYYRDYLSHTVNLTLPDQQLQQAYDWSRISVLQGLVTNPKLGTGLIAGYRTSGTGQRPGFAWYFGRDSFWTSFALNSIGDFTTTRTALQFISQFQREDGKVPHEVSQGAGFLQWFKDYPYPYASVDATPLYIIATADYVLTSGDREFAREKWDSLWMAHQFLESTYDSRHLAQNFGFGHGWIEGGPLLPVKSEFYQSALAVQSLQALARLATVLNKQDVARELESSFERQKAVLNDAFWSPQKNAYIFALDPQDQRVDEVSVLSTVPMWFGLTNVGKSESTLQQLASADHQTDWGMRIISGRSPVYSGAGYHFGSIWPLFTGWASVAEYRYHQALSAYTNLRANALLALDGSLGHVTEVLSGDYYQPLSTSSPHQIWSAAMVISPILRGMLGLDLDQVEAKLTFAPHLPLEWHSVSVDNLSCGTKLGFTYRREAGLIALDLSKTDGAKCILEFSPEISQRSDVVSVDLAGRRVPFHIARGTTDQHVIVNFAVPEDKSSLHIRLKNDFGLSLSSQLPALGGASEGLRVLSQSWNSSRTAMTLSLSGLPDKHYELSVLGPSQIAAVDGGKLRAIAAQRGILEVKFTGNSGSYVQRSVVLSFVRPK